MSGKLRVGVVGVGHLGQNHLRLYHEIDDVVVTGIADISGEVIQTYGERYDVFGTENYRDLIGRVDAVSIVVPTVLHQQIAADFLDAGVQVLVEKPVTRTLEEAEDLVSRARHHGVILQVGHVERFNSAVLKVKKEINDPRYIECQRLGPFPGRSTDVGVVLDLMIHDIDIILDLVDSPVERITAIGIPVISRYEDIANAHILFQNGCIANVTASRITDDRVRKLRIFQREAYFSLDYADQEFKIQRKNTDNEIVSERPEVRKGEPLMLELKHFIDCIREGKKPMVSGEQGRDALEIALQIVEQVKTEYGYLGKP
ncbi:MAG: Gfo/Idh/MocA family oxidoreductase [bacterium]|jgi:predicted dehydrogenase|nr:Gfo/Idh/MocA family oxidoreductase [bacterium]